MKPLTGHLLRKIAFCRFLFACVLCPILLHPVLRHGVKPLCNHAIWTKLASFLWFRAHVACKVGIISVVSGPCHVVACQAPHALRGYRRHVPRCKRQLSLGQSRNFFEQSKKVKTLGLLALASLLWPKFWAQNDLSHTHTSLLFGIFFPNYTGHLLHRALWQDYFV